MPTSLKVVNLDQTTFDCTFGRGCEGHCCKNGRPSVSEEEQERIAALQDRFLPLLREDARELVEESGFISNRTKAGLPMVRVSEGWCVFFNQGCVLHQLGATDGDSLKYKPIQCAIFPLDKSPDGTWYVRQWNYRGEQWNDLFCLNPEQSTRPARESLEGELNRAELSEE